jgi:hypothetical protein
LLLKSESFMDFENRLYERQNMPSSGETMSPAEKNFKRAFRSHLPTLERFFNPVQKDSEAKIHFKVGDTVRIQNAVSKLWDDSGVIREVRESGRSYYIDRGSGRDIILRNNIYLKLIPERETKRDENDFLNEQQKSDSLNAQQQLRRDEIENNSLRNAQQQQIAGSKSRDTLKLRRSKRIEQAGSLQARSNLVIRSIGNKYLAKRRSLGSLSLREKHAVKSLSLPLHRPAVAMPAAMEQKRESNSVRKQTIRFAP